MQPKHLPRLRVGDILDVLLDLPSLFFGAVGLSVVRKCAYMHTKFLQIQSPPSAAI